MKRHRKQSQQLENDLRALLLKWDPIGCSPPPDEYNCLIEPLLQKLQSGCNVEFIARFLHRELKDHFGLSRETGVEDFAQMVVDWYVRQP